LEEKMRMTDVATKILDAGNVVVSGDEEIKALARSWVKAKDDLNKAKERLDILQVLLWRSMESNEDQRVIVLDEGSVTRPERNEYDVGKVEARLKELMPEGEWKKLYKPEKEEVRILPPKIDGHEARRIKRQGGERKRILEECTLPQRMTLSLTKK
jgi:hypothetical protein